jgi:hypothetical protein
LLDKLPDPETRRWYAAKAIEHNWSRNILVIQGGFETRPYGRVFNCRVNNAFCLFSRIPRLTGAASARCSRACLAAASNMLR